jgi:hypothetical protein
MVPSVSVIIATRNRPHLVGRLLEAIRAQDWADYEVIVADDGSTAENREAYQRLFQGFDERFRFLTPTPAGATPSWPAAGRNRAIHLAQGEFLAFCDDDDTWLRPDHLRVAVTALRASQGDVFFANMCTVSGGVVQNADWYAQARPALQHALLPGFTDVFLSPLPAVARLLQSRHIHMDTLVCRKSTAVAAGLFVESLLVAEDAHFGLTLCDRASAIVFRSTVVGELDVSPHESANRSIDAEGRLLFGMMCFRHASGQVRDSGLRLAARRGLSWRLMELGQLRLAAGRSGQAFHLAIQSLVTRPSLAALVLAGKAIFS